MSDPYEPDVRARIQADAHRKRRDEKPLDVALSAAHAASPLHIDTPQGIADANRWFMSNRRRHNGKWVADWRLYGWGTIR